MNALLTTPAVSAETNALASTFEIPHAVTNGVTTIQEALARQAARYPVGELPKVRYETVPLSEISINREINEETKRKQTKVRFQGEEMAFSDRTTMSFLSYIGQGPTVLDLFSCEEVCERFLQVKAADADSLKVRVAIETVSLPKGGTFDRMLAITRPEKPVITPEMVHDIIVKGNPYETWTYNNGMITSRHASPVVRESSIEGDRFTVKTFLNMPIDGYGDPAGYTGMMRLACLNGLVVMVAAAKSKFILGENDPTTTVLRLLGTYYNADNVDAISERLEAAAKVPVSLGEYNMFHKSLDDCRCFSAHRLHAAVGQQAYEKLGIISAGEVLEQRHRKVALDGLSVYDVINAATELATHHADGFGAAVLNGLVGRLISKQEYDLEGVLEHEGPARALFFDTNISALGLGAN